MRLIQLILSCSLLFFLACGTTGSAGSEVIDPRYDPANPAVSSSPRPTTATTVPQDPNAPSTYGNPQMAARGAEATPATYGSTAVTAAAVAAPLVGNWINKSDPDENIVFTDHSYTSYYEGQRIVEEEMTYHAQCPGSCSGGQSVGVPCFTITSDFGTDCYGIIRVTETELELSVIGQSTETVTYLRSNP